MGHLAIVSNLLTSLGAAPHFDRPNFPQSCVYYPPDYRLELLPFSDVTIERFVHLERPEGASWEGRVETAPARPPASANENEIGPKAESFTTVTDLYAATQPCVRSASRKTSCRGLRPTPGVRRPTRAFLPGCALAIPPRTREREDREEAHAASSRHHLSA